MNEEEQFDTLSETDSSDETLILKVEQHAICFMEDCKESLVLNNGFYIMIHDLDLLA